MSSCGQTAPSTACSGPRVLLYDLDEGAAVGAESPRLIKHLTSQGIQDDVDATTVGQAQNALGEDGVSRPKDLPGIDAVVLDQELAFLLRPDRDKNPLVSSQLNGGEANTT
jgi:hypothetical protein